MIKRFFRGLGSGLLFLAVAILLLPVILPPFLDRTYYEGPISENYDGEYFFNPDEDEGGWVGDPTSQRSPRRSSMLLRMIFGDDRPPWPDSVPVHPTVPDQRIEGDRMVTTWVGHSSTLIQTQGLNILTDPIWSDYASPIPPLGPRRVAEPGIRFEDLPPIDLVVISHNHYDHLDLDTLRRLWERDEPLIVTSLGNDTVIAQAGAEAVTRDWGGTVEVSPEVSVIVTRNHHWGSRWGTDRNRALWSSFIITTPAGNIFFGGDTGPGDMRWPEEAAAYGPVRLAFIPIGAFRFQQGQDWSGSHIGPMHAIQVWNRLGRPVSIGIHWGTFRLSWEGYWTPARMLEMLQDCAEIEDGFFRAVRHGQRFDVPPVRMTAEVDEARVESCAAEPEIRALD